MILHEDSGHFQLIGSEAMNYSRTFRNSSLNAVDLCIAISEFDTSMSNYVFDEYVFYQGPIQYMSH